MPIISYWYAKDFDLHMMKWSIAGSISADVGSEKKNLYFFQQLTTSGQKASHPTFPLIYYNVQSRKSVAFLFVSVVCF